MTIVVQGIVGVSMEKSVPDWKVELAIIATTDVDLILAVLVN